MQKEKFLLTEETHMYTIGQVSEMFSLPISTLRYYDKEGLFPQMERSSGIRRFSERELEALRVIECLKRSGLEIKEIKQFMQWCAEGSGTYPQRHALFEHQLEMVKAEMSRLEKTMDMLRFKCWYYERAMADGTMQQLLLPTDSLFTDCPAVALTAEGAERIARGAVVFPRQTDSLPETAGTLCRVYHEGRFLMLGQVRELDKGGLGLFVYKNFR